MVEHLFLQAAAFTLGCLFSADAAATDVAELTNIEGRLTHYLADLLITPGRERDQVCSWPGKAGPSVD